MDYQIKTNAGLTAIEAPAGGLKIEVQEQQQGQALQGLPYALGTLYQIKGGFVPVKVFVFKVTGPANPELEALKQFMDFFFTNILDTDRYVKEIPQDSALYAQESARLFGKPTVAA